MTEFPVAVEVAEMSDIPVESNSAPPAGPLALSEDVLRSQLRLLVQSLGDCLPDDVVSFARAALERSESLEAVDAVLFSAIRFDIGLSPVEFQVLAECLESLGGEPEELSFLHVDDVARPLMFAYHTDPESTSPEEVANSDDDVLARFANSEGVLGIWRSWRRPFTGASWPPERPVYLIEADSDDVVSDVSSAAYGAEAPGPSQNGPLVEVYVTGSPLTAMLQSMQFSAELLHSSEPAGDYLFADVFDGEPDADGAPQELEHLEEQEAVAVLDYLAQGRPVMLAEAPAADLLDSERGENVPLHLRTDGTWIWSDATAYYVAEHAIAPPRDFRTYLAEVAGTETRVSDATVHQVAGWLQSEDPDEADDADEALDVAPNQD